MRLPDSLDLSLIIPVYNERDSLKVLHEKIVAAVAPLHLQWEVIYIDDGSSDGSADVLAELFANDSHVVVATQRRNFGKSLALATGFALARGAIVITMDADLQDEPAEIPNMLAKLDEGYDVVSGWKHNRQDPFSKRGPSWVANRVTSLMTGLHLRDMNSGFKAYRATAVRQIHIYGDLHRYIPVLAHFAGFKVGEIPVTHHPRQFGQSKYGPGRFIRGGLDLITVLFLNQYGRRPLHLFGGGGGVIFAIGLFINAFLSIEWLLGRRGLGNRPLLTFGVLMMLVGIQFITIGLLAELIVSFIQRNEDPLNITAHVHRGEATEDEPVRESETT
ncbi:MAG: glycosyltransferase [Chloroflexi bacterium]|nr:MAG: glycosyltransferase [Chloroflexota bacterium]